MNKFCVPLNKPQPDAARFIRCLLGEEHYNKPPTIEYMVDLPVMKKVTTDLLKRDWADNSPVNRNLQKAYWDNVIEFWYRMGYDFVIMEMELPFKRRTLRTRDTVYLSDGEREWADEHHGVIRSWETFDTYNWPRIEDFDFFPFEYVNSHLPDCMGFMASHAGGVFEHLTWIMSLEGLSLAIYDDLELVKATVHRIGMLIEKFNTQLLDMENLIALWPGDDMGFRTGTLVSADFLRHYILPWHRRCAEMAHGKGKPYFLHACGNLEAIMEDLIEDVGIDARHSFENNIMPAQEFHKKYGDRIATLGGVDIHMLSSAYPNKLRQYVRNLIDACASKGRFAVGSGNSIPNYVPLENYLTMIDEALSWIQCSELIQRIREEI